MIWRKLDLWGQLLVWFLSLVPLYLLTNDRAGNGWGIVLLLHGLVLLVLGIWQATSSVTNLIRNNKGQGAIFRKNLWIAAGMILLFLLLMAVPATRGVMRSSAVLGRWLLFGYFLLVNLCCFRYWIVLKKFYRDGEEKNIGIRGINESGTI